MERIIWKEKKNNKEVLNLVREKPTTPKIIEEGRGKIFLAICYELTLLYVSLSKIKWKAREETQRLEKLS